MGPGSPALPHGPSSVIPTLGALNAPGQDPLGQHLTNLERNGGRQRCEWKTGWGGRKEGRRPHSPTPDRYSVSLVFSEIQMVKPKKRERNL